MGCVSKRNIILIALFITVCKVVLLYKALVYLENSNYKGDEVSVQSSRDSIGFGEFRNGKFIITEINSVASLDHVEKSRKIVTDHVIYFRNEMYNSRNFTREKRMLRQSTLNFSPKIIKTSTIEKLLPNIDDPVNDRIFEQMSHIPIQYSNRSAFKTIYMFGGKRGWGHPEGQSSFLMEECLVNRCHFTYDKKMASSADAVVFGNPNQIRTRPPFRKASPNQIWIVSAIESPPNTGRLQNYHGLVNWTMTYRTDSVIVTPYFKYKVFPEKVSLTRKNYAEGKQKKVVWFVSNCNRESSGRMKYAREVQKYISVDIYGRCGELKCPKSKPWCTTMVKTDYKFYLAFENTKCKDYMTEKIMTAYTNDVIPVVLGAAPSEYKSALPAHSYIDVEDFETPKDLAEYLLKLDKNDDLYNEYFRWKSYGDFVASKPWCRVCSLLHEQALPSIWYDDIDAWWRSDGSCVNKNISWWSNVLDK
ncbi:glycoprotein 3-alpha-L-fucosyltransferase A-like [Saccostrea echinata]|uniref:glycoprotein 3-alpha-L-fucosyltransferase A-like n=1 Tax=Saccostrea echinata TaxID=191078 RepID=UPI002A81EE6F|nr:glycoprotein 3-alpha-L-fucosyltransferase A-like [Saccostrea echinata]